MNRNVEPSIRTGAAPGYPAMTRHAVIFTKHPYRGIAARIAEEPEWQVYGFKAGRASPGAERPFEGVFDLHAVLEEAKNEPLPPDVLAAARDLEARYDINIADILINDRHMGIGWVTGGLYHRGRLASLPYERHLHVILRTFESFEGLLDKVRPDFVCSGANGSFEMAILHTVARSRNVPHFDLRKLGDGDHWFWARDPTIAVPGLEEAYLQAKHEDPEPTVRAADIAPQVRDSVPDYRKEGTWRHVLEKLAGSTRVEVLQFLTGYRKTGEIYFREKIRYILRRFWNFRKEMRRDYASLKDLGKTDFLLYPLHYEPEASLNGTEPHFTNQTYAIEMLSKAVPADTFVVVKEHPWGVGNRPAGWMDRIADFPRVRLVHPFESTVDIIPHAVATATITGTAGLEAALMACPVISLGPNYRFNFVDHVHHADGLLDLRRILRELESADDGQEEERRRCAAALGRAIDQVCFRMPGVGGDWKLSEDNVDRAWSELLSALEGEKGTTEPLKTPG